MFKARWLLVLVLANVAPFDSEAKILNNEYTIDDKGNHKLSFRTSNGMTKEEIGSIVNEGEPDEYVSVIGRYTYFSSEGKEGKFGYTAGEDRYNNILPQVPQTVITAAKPTKPPKLVASLLGK